MTFEEWMKAVDIEFIALTGLDRDSWPDALYYDNWEAGIGPACMVVSVIEDEYGEEGLAAFDIEF